MNTIKLTHYELAMASEVGRQRQLTSMQEGRQPAHGYTGTGWEEHIEGACGEIAVAKALGIYWNGSINTFKNPDLGTNLQIRTRSQHNWDLIVRPTEPNNHHYILVTGTSSDPEGFRIHGYITGSEAKQPQWLADHGSRPTAYFVPSTALHPLAQLTRPLRSTA